ncbi:MAG: ExeM/NucH family extracellular endonuclease [Marinobacter sp.]|nr:ExeM/NucH family extracellular endonuclease [Marinobacter sp.]
MTDPRWLPLLLALLLLPAQLAAQCGAPATSIPSVRAMSPDGFPTVTVEAVMTLDARGPDRLRGFFLQQPDSDPSPLSKGLFVYTARDGGGEGRRVRLTARVNDYQGRRQLSNVSQLKDCGPAPLPPASPLVLPWPEDLELDTFEGMRVSFNQPLTVIDNYQLDRFGKLILAAEPQLMPTQIMPPGPAAAALAAQQERHRIRLDDGRGQQYPLVIPFPPPALRADHTVRAGDQVRHLDGILDHRFGNWRIHPLQPPTFHTTNPRPDPIPRAEGSQLRIAAFNLENLFLGDAGFPTPRGAQSPAELERQLAKLTNALQALDADILPLMELENNGTGADSTVARLAARLGEQWQWVRVQPPQHTGTDQIQVGILYRRDQVTAIGDADTLHQGPFSQGNRPALAQLFRHNDSGQTLRVVVLHLKSKRCQRAQGADRDQDDGQSCYARTRTRAAETLAAWLSQLPKPAQFRGTLITGDLNSYAQETPLQVLHNAGYANMVAQFHGLEAHSYRFRGRAGTLDYLLADRRLQPHVLAAQPWNINADEPPALGYSLANKTRQQQRELFSAAPWRSSDHNPLIIDLGGF